MWWWKKKKEEIPIDNPIEGIVNSLKNNPEDWRVYKEGAGTISLHNSSVDVKILVCLGVVILEWATSQECDAIQKVVNEFLKTRKLEEHAKTRQKITNAFNKDK